MYCKHCGREIDDNSSFCKFCGREQFEVKNNIFIEDSQYNKEINTVKENDQEPTIRLQEDNFGEVIRDFFILAVKVLGIIIISVFMIGASIIFSHSIYPTIIVIIGIISFYISYYLKNRNNTSDESKIERSPLFYLCLVLLVFLILFFAVKYMLLNAINSYE